MSFIYPRTPDNAPAPITQHYDSDLNSSPLPSLGELLQAKRIAKASAAPTQSESPLLTKKAQSTPDHGRALKLSPIPGRHILHTRNSTPRLLHTNAHQDGTHETSAILMQLNHKETVDPSDFPKGPGTQPSASKKREHTVERVIKRQARRRWGGRRKVVKYLIKWAGYGPEHNSWVLSRDIHPDVVAKFLSVSGSAHSS